jgi:hypothetical protein
MPIIFITMKKLNLFFAILVVTTAFFAGCKKDETSTGDDDNNNGSGGGSSSLVVENKQRSLLAYVTATWCGPCGQYGGPNFKAAVTEKGTSEIIALNIQTSSSRLTPYFKRLSSMDNQDSVYIAPIFSNIFASLNIPTNAQGGFSIPSFSMNNAFLGTSNVTSATMTNNATSYNSNAPVVGVAAKKTISGNTITVDVKSKFFKEGSGEYFWSALVVEKSVTGYQLVGGTPNENYEHKYNVRASMQNGEMYNQSVFGSSSFASGTVAVGTEFTKTFKLNYVNYTSINPAFGVIQWNLNPVNTNVAVIVWKKNGTRYDFVNGFVAE